MNIIRRFFVPGCGALLLPLAVWAQPAPLVTPRDLRPETPSPAPASVPQAAPVPAPPGAESLSVTLKDARVTGGFPELEGATSALVAPLAGKRLAATEFYAVAGRIEALYHAAGFPLVRVLIPPQAIRDGETLQITVLDGFIEHVDVAAVAVRARALVERSVRTLEGQRRLTSGQLERVLTLAGRGPGVTLRSTLAAGTTAGGVILVLEAEHDPYGGSFSIDNRNSEALGPWQATVQLRENQMFGLGEQAYLYLSGGPPLSRAFRSGAPRRVIGGGATFPIGSDGLTLNPELTWSDTVNPAAGFTPVTDSRFKRFTLRLSYPVRLTREEELNVNLAFEAADQSTRAPEFDVTLSEDRLRVLRAGADWSTSVPALHPGARLRMSMTLSKGLDALGARSHADATASGIGFSRGGSDPAFSKLEAGAVYDQPLFLGWTTHTVIRLQRARGVLPSSELFSLDGEDALSTFRTGTLSDDHGWLLRQEFARPLKVAMGSGEVNLLPYVFGAVGRTSTATAAGNPRGTSSAWGVGLLTAWRAVNISMEYGRRNSHPDDLDGTQFFLKGQVQF